MQESYGGPEGLKRLVDACHPRGLAVVLDVVYNHLGPEGNYLSRLRPLLHRPVPHAVGTGRQLRRPLSATRSGGSSIENALYWLREFHVDALRLDAVHAIMDFSATPFLAELAGAVQ